MHVNCDIGERGADHPVDRELMRHISLANIACGGHAGDAESVDAFKELARAYAVPFSAHLSYPDKERFGRRSMDIASADLLRSLDAQYALLGGADTVKFHGALYNDSWADSGLAGTLATWLKGIGVRTVVAPHRSRMANEGLARGLAVLYEAFAERRYAYDPRTGGLSLVDRKRDYASIEELEEAVSQAAGIIERKRTLVYIDADDGSAEKAEADIRADTICVHSDSPLSLELAIRLSGMRGA